MLKTFKPFNVLLVSLIFFCNCALAQTSCNCTTPDIKTAFSNSSLVFIGSVVKITPSTLKPGYNEVVFLTNGIFKGEEEVRQKSVIIYTKQKPEECGQTFSHNFDYIVYASGLPVFYTTTNCSRNTLLESANDEIIRLHELYKR